MAFGVFTFMMVFALSSCGLNSSPSETSNAFEKYVISESQRIADAWDSSIQPLLSSTDTSSQESTNNLATSFAAFSILVKNSADGIPSDPGAYKEENRVFRTALADLSIQSTNAWTALIKSDPVQLQTAMDTINNSFVKLTVLVKNFSRE